MENAATDRRASPPGAAFSTWTAPDGWPLRRMDWPQANGAASRGSLLFANGRGDFIEKYLEPLGHWHVRGWNVTSFDWRGQGASRGDIVGGNLRSFDPLVNDLDALVSAWRAATPAPHVVVGHSMGGHLLLRWLVERQPSLDAAVLVAPMLGVNVKALSPRMARSVARFLCVIGLRDRLLWKVKPGGAGRFRQGFLTHCPHRFEDELWWKAEQPGFDLGAPSWGWLNAAFDSTAALSPAMLRRVRTPVLIVGTDADRLVSPGAIREAARHLPDAQLYMFRDAAHELLRESDPARLEALERIDRFLDERAPA